MQEKRALKDVPIGYPPPPLCDRRVPINIGPLEKALVRAWSSHLLHFCRSCGDAGTDRNINCRLPRRFHGMCTPMHIGSVFTRAVQTCTSACVPPCTPRGMQPKAPPQVCIHMDTTRVASLRATTLYPNLHMTPGTHTRTPGGSKHLHWICTKHRRVYAPEEPRLLERGQCNTRMRVQSLVACSPSVTAPRRMPHRVAGVGVWGIGGCERGRQSGNSFLFGRGGGVSLQERAAINRHTLNHRGYTQHSLVNLYRPPAHGAGPQRRPAQATSGESVPE
mmetsp:Transcript_78721/g.132031  ORF Transcript_78721/g.132031 Transcript_78721/m.132031 type:complete len:277 (+) Transcript_78721:558-1388(+)